MRNRDIIAALESIAPTRLAESWDRVGLLVGDAEREARGPVLLTIDLTEAVLDEATSMGSRFVVAYHPPIWEPLHRATTDTTRERRILRAIEREISIYSPHTALDCAAGGLTDWLCEGLSGSSEAGKIRGDCRALSPRADRAPTQELKIVTFVPEKEVDQVRAALATAGCGIIGAYSVCSFTSPGTGTFLGGEGASPAVGHAGKLESVPEVRLEMVCSRAALALALETLRGFHPYEEPAVDVYELLAKPSRAVGPGRRLVLDRPATLRELALRLQTHTRSPRVLVASSRGRGPDDPAPVSTLAVVPGAGASQSKAAVDDHCEVFVTGEMKHHEVNALLDAGVSVILGGHTPTERGYLPRYADRLRGLVSGLEVRVSERDRDPLIPI